MSETINNALLERAQEALEEWSGTMWARVIQRDIDSSDLEALKYHLAQAEAEEAIQEDYNSEAGQSLEGQSLEN